MVHLHMRSSYSLLESPIRLENMILHQKQLGYNHVCLTDHNVMYGTMEFYQLCKKHNVHPIIGLEVDSIYNEEPFHFILLAKNDMGLQNLYRLSSIIKETVIFDEVIKYAKDCVVLTSSDGKDTFSAYIEHQDLEKLSAFVEFCKNSFSDFYVSIAMNDSGKKRADNRILKQLDCKRVALSRILYENSENVKSLQVLRAIAKQTNIENQGLDVQFQRYLRSPQEMEQLYDESDLETTEECAMFKWRFKNQSFLRLKTNFTLTQEII